MPKKPDKPEITVTYPTGEHRQAKAASWALVQADLMALTGDVAGRRYALDRSEIVIGRDPDVAIQIPAGDVSRRHALIRQIDGGNFVIEDLKSRNGTLVNGAPVEVRVLNFGDKIQVGSRTLFVFAYHQAQEEHLVQWQRLELIGQMAAGLVHDFNNYMAALMGFIQYLQTTINPEMSKEDLIDLVTSTLPIMDTAAREGSNLARRVLNFARGSKRPQFPFELAPLVEEATSLVRRNLGVAIKVETDLQSSLRIIGDRTEMLQVLINLFLNARDAMPKGGTLRIEGEVCPADGDDALAVQANEQVLLRVRDTGVGMNEETRRRIFEPMYTTKGAGKGSGLGLSTVWRIIESHHGAINVESTPGQGTVFSIHLPVPEARRIPLKVNTTLIMRQLEPPLGEPSKHQGSGVVLVQEEDDLMCQRVARAVCSLGYEVLFAGSGDEVSELFDLYGARVRLVVLSEEDPTGEAASKKLLAKDPALKVVFTSREQGWPPEAHPYRLPIPCDTRTFMEAITRVLEEHR